MSAAEQKDESGSFKIPNKLAGYIISLAAASLLPTGAFGLVARSNSSMSDKLDAVISRLDRLEAAGIGQKIDDHEMRMRALEHRVDVLEARVGK